MYLGLRSVVYPVADLTAAGIWYEKVFNQPPSLREKSMIGFEVGHDRIWLAAVPTPEESGGGVAYWAVSDIDGEFERLKALGALAVHPPERATGEYCQARLRDPFGNIFGIIGIKSDPEDSAIDDQASRTALWTTLMRAFSNEGEPSPIGCADHLARIFLLQDQVAALEDRENRQEHMDRFFVVGVYVYVTARTHLFDAFFKEALAAGFEQIVMLGAGYDSRACRFAGDLGPVRVFEVDASKTQERKIACLARAGLRVPEQVSYVPLNFNTGSLVRALDDAGFDPDKRTFFSWEGVTFYLAPEAVAATLSCIKSHAGPGSVVAFDFIELWPGIFEAFGVKELIAFNRKHQSGESGNRFAVEQGRIADFLGGLGFEITDFLGTKDIEAGLKHLDDRFDGHVTASFRIVRAAAV